MKSDLARHRRAILLFAMLLFVLQALPIHVHDFAEHLAIHGHTHPVQMHLQGAQTPDDDHEVMGGSPLAGELLAKRVLGGLMILPFLAVLLFARPLIRRLAHRPESLPVHRIIAPLRPPLRAPPR